MDITTKLQEISEAITKGNANLKHVDVINDAIEYIQGLEDKMQNFPEPALYEGPGQDGILIENINIYIQKENV